MNIQFLEDIGLTKVQAEAYKALVDNGTQSAPALANIIGESRTNGYKVLDKLIELGLAIKEPIGGKFKYSATSPAGLEQFLKLQAETVRQKERRLNSELPHLLNYYFARSERPSIRYFEGKDGVVSIYKDQIATGQKLCYIRTPSELAYMPLEELHYLRNLFPKFGIKRCAITPDLVRTKELPLAERVPIAESDRHMMLRRTWIDKDDYTAPVEWAAYGDKLSIVQYGEETMGMIIESPPIAEAFRQLFGLLDEGIRRRPRYDKMPINTEYTAMPESLKKK